MKKIERFEYLSNFYKKLLGIQEEIEKTGVISLKIGIENFLELSLGKIEKADIIFKSNFKEIIKEMINVTEIELKQFFE